MTDSASALATTKEFLGGGMPHGVGKRHDVSRNLIRNWVADTTHTAAGAVTMDRAATRQQAPMEETARRAGGLP